MEINTIGNNEYGINIETLIEHILKNIDELKEKGVINLTIDDSYTSILTHIYEKGIVYKIREYFLMERQLLFNAYTIIINDNEITIKAKNESKINYEETEDIKEKIKKLGKEIPKPEESNSIIKNVLGIQKKSKSEELYKKELLKKIENSTKKLEEIKGEIPELFQKQGTIRKELYKEYLEKQKEMRKRIEKRIKKEKIEKVKEICEDPEIASEIYKHLSEIIDKKAKDPLKEIEKQVEIEETNKETKKTHQR